MTTEHPTDAMYADTAYRGQPAASVGNQAGAEPLSWTRQKSQADPLPRQGPQCAEYPKAFDVYDKDAADPKSTTGRLYQHSQGTIWPTFRNPAMIISIINPMAWVFLALGVVTFAVQFFFIDHPTDLSFDAPWHDGWFIIIAFILTPLAIAISTKILTLVPKISRTGNTIFRRNEGRIYPHRKLSDQPLYFADFDAYVFRYPRGSGGTGIKLMLRHRNNGVFLIHPADHMGDPGGVLLEWEMTQHYMDVRLPLPDTPEMEPFRAEDPVTAEWDAKRQRPPYWWRNLSFHQAQALKEAATEAARHYPWGKTREEAKASGWRPSIYSQVLFEEADYEALMRFLAQADPNNAENVRSAQPVV